MVLLCGAFGGALQPWPGETAFAFPPAGVPVVWPLFAHPLAAPPGACLSPTSVVRACARSPFELGLCPASFPAQAEDLRVLQGSPAEQAQPDSGPDVPVVLLHGARAAAPRSAGGPPCTPQDCSPLRSPSRAS